MGLPVGLTIGKEMREGFENVGDQTRKTLYSKRTGIFRFEAD